MPGERIEDLPDEGRAWEPLAPWDVHAGNARMERHAIYPFPLFGSPPMRRRRPPCSPGCAGA